MRPDNELLRHAGAMVPPPRRRITEADKQPCGNELAADSNRNRRSGVFWLDIIVFAVVVIGLLVYSGMSK